MNWEKIRLSFAFVCALTLSASYTYAETTEQEFSAISKIISLSKDIPSGEIDLGVVYDPDSPISQEDMQAIKKIIGVHYKGPKHIFKFKKVPLSNVAIDKSPILFLTDGLPTSVQKETLSHASENNQLTITTSLPYVKAGNCVIGVDVGNSVKIIMSSKAYNNSGLKFDPAFEFMVKEI